MGACSVVINDPGAGFVAIFISENGRTLDIAADIGHACSYLFAIILDGDDGLALERAVIDTAVVFGRFLDRSGNMFC